MAQYFDNILGALVPVTYTWEAVDTASDTWADLQTWADGSSNYSVISSVEGVPDVEFYTAIIDHGKAEWVNPLIQVVGQGTIITKVYASTTQPSDYISGEPALIVAETGNLDGVYGRYFQFKVEVFSDSASVAQLSSVATELSTNTFTEFFQESSTLHNGTTEMRYPTLTKTYSKILSLNGHARLVDTDDSTPLLVTGIGDRSANAISITNSGGVDAIETVYKFEPAALRFNDNTGSALTDTDDNITFPLSGTGITTGDFQIDFWYQPVKMTWLDGISSPPNYAHSPYFFHLDTGGTDLYLRTGTANSAIEIQYSTNGSTWTTTGSFVYGNNPGGDWYQIKVARDNGTLKLRNHNLATVSVGSYTQDISSATMRLGDLGGNATVGNFYMDDFRISDTFRAPGSSGGPNFDEISGAEPILDPNTQFLLTGQTTNVTPSQTNVPVVTVGVLTDRTQARYAIYRSSGQVVDADVALQVIGLRGISTQGRGSITEAL